MVQGKDRKLASRPGSIPIISLAALAALLVIAGSPWVIAQEVDDETCLACHDGYSAGLEGSAHQLGLELRSASTTLACISCHSGGETHIDDPSIDNIGNPARMETQKAQAACSQCHQPHTETGTLGFDPHIGHDLSCTSCHKVHSYDESLVKGGETELCAQCHTASTARFSFRSNHPLESGDISCLSCHDFKAQNEPMFGHGGSVNCAGCHQEVAGPYLHEHEAISSFSTEGEGCVACHEPHGSVNDRLLKQAGDQLCYQCHGQPPEHLIAHGGIGSQFMCMECHSAVHGSNVNRSLLDAQLGTKIGGSPGSCFCHNIED